jgi:mercuric ion transport protein
VDTFARIANDKGHRRPWSALGAFGFTIGGFGAAFALAACCALPMLLAGVGLGGAWLFGIARIAAHHRIIFLGAAAVFLMGGAVTLGRQVSDGCATGWCRYRAVRSVLAAALVGGLVLLVLGYRYV